MVDRFADVDPAALARSVISVGFDGASPDAAPLAALREFGPGAVTLFARNVGAPNALRALVSALRDIGTPPPLIAIDQEGGRVARIDAGVVALPSAMALGATGDAALAGTLAAMLGRDLARLGVSVNFAPVADLALHAASSVIGTRAFGDEPARVGAFVVAFARGLERGGVAAAVKHFPGHGATAQDSHSALPRIDAAAATLGGRDLVPFVQAIAARAASIVMSAHIVIDAIDPIHPATLSHAVLTGLLRDELGFEGVIATDCLEMDAIATGIGTVDGAVAALAAGADLLLVSHHLDLAFAAGDAIGAAVRAGTLPLARLHDAAARVLRLRERLAVLQPSEDVFDDGLALVAARRAVTVIRGAPQLAAGHAVTVISFEGAAVDRAAASGSRTREGERPSLSSALRRRRWKSEVMRVPLVPDGDDVDLLLETLARLGAREFVIVTRGAHVRPEQRAAVARILALVPNALIVSAGAPYDALLWPAARRVVCIYGDTALAFEGCADVLDGRAPGGGALPVTALENAAVR